MGIRRILRTAFQSTISNHEVKDHKAVKKEIARGVVRRTATGNVNLQCGRYLTKEDIEARLESVKGSSR